MQHYQRLNIHLEPSRHAALLLASKRAGISMLRLMDVAVSDLLDRIAREGSVTLPMRDVGEFRVINRKLGPSLAAAPAPGAPLEPLSNETLAAPVAAALIGGADGEV